MGSFCDNLPKVNLFALELQNNQHWRKGSQISSIQNNIIFWGKIKHKRCEKLEFFGFWKTAFLDLLSICFKCIYIRIFPPFYYHIHLPTKKGSFIIWFCHNEISQNTTPPPPNALSIVGKSSTSKGAPRWFCNV